MLAFGSSCVIEQYKVRDVVKRNEKCNIVMNIIDNKEVCHSILKNSDLFKSNRFR